MSLRDRSYFYQRAETELKMARSAETDAAAKIHYTLAGHYLDRFYNDATAGATPRTPVLPRSAQ